jgi:hypothetical protein
MESYQGGILNMPSCRCCIPGCQNPTDCDSTVCTQHLIDAITEPNASDIYEFEIDQLKEREKKVGNSESS